MNMNSISASCENNPIKDKSYIVPLDFNVAKALPRSHTWTQPNDDHPCVDPDHSVLDSIPTIDLADSNIPMLVRRACTEWGMFQVTNHGIPIDLLNQVRFQTQRLFALPAEQKQLALRSPGGTTGYGGFWISKFFDKLMWSECFSMIGSPQPHARLLWPNNHGEFCDVMEKYQEKMMELSGRIIWLMLTSLGLTQEDVCWFNFESKATANPPHGYFQLNSYPICPDPKNTLGLAAHTDSSLVTLLYQNDTHGLQVLKPGLGWVAVRPLPGAIVVNIGDLMSMFTNGLFVTAMHRAVVNGSSHRMSMGYFYGPAQDVTIVAPSKLIDDDHRPRYRPITWKEYLDVRAVHFNKALENVMLSNP